MQLAGTRVSGDISSFVWSFWDGSTITTSGTLTQKLLDRGGVLPWTCRALNSAGVSYVVAGSVIVNAPPVLRYIGIDANDRPAPYSGTLTAVLEDPEGAGAITAYLDNVSRSTVSSSGTVYIPYTIDTDKTLIFSGTDANGGLSRLSVDFRTTPLSSIFMDGGVSPLLGRIGPGKSIVVSAIVEDERGAEITEVDFDFLAEGGWSGGTTQVVYPVDIGGGVYQALTQKDISAETGGSKSIGVTALTSTSSKVLSLSASLVDNNPPVVSGFSFGTNVSDGLPVEITALVTDPDEDLVSNRWWFTKPPGVEVFGNPAEIVASGSVVAGSLVSTDNYGGETVTLLPKLAITSPLHAEGVAGYSFRYELRAMGYAPISYSALNLPAGLLIQDNIISGTPVNFGQAEIGLGATNADGSDSKTLSLVVSPYPSPPPSPTNTKVNGVLYDTPPTYSSGSDLVLTWSIVNDNPALDTPSSVVNFYTSAGVLLRSVDVTSGTTEFTLTNAALQSLYGGQPDVKLRIYSKRSILSDFYQETTVIRI